MGLFHHVLFYMGDIFIFGHALNSFILDAGILIMVQQVSLMMFSLTIAYPSSCCPPGILLGGQVQGTNLRCSYSLSFVVGPLLHA